jgi:hypothetical protein
MLSFVADLGDLFYYQSVTPSHDQSTHKVITNSVKIKQNVVIHSLDFFYRFTEYMRLLGGGGIFVDSIIKV